MKRIDLGMQRLEYARFKVLWALVIGMLLMSCRTNTNRRSPFSLQGAWVLTQVKVPEGYISKYSTGEGTYLRLYEGDSTMYECRVTQTTQALVVRPEDKCDVTLVNKGAGEYLYLEEDDPRPLTVVDDSTMMIQRMGRLYIWRRADGIAQEWGTEIRLMIDRDLESRESYDDVHSYVLSAMEREQAHIIHRLVYAIIAIVVLVVIVAQIAVTNRREKRRLQLQLQQIHEEHDERPQPVRQAIASVESAYFSSDEHRALQRRIVTGQRLKNEEWDEIEAQLKKVYPGFTSQLRNLHPMSELEYQTCLLIKLRIAPKDIAAVLSRDVSTISTVRSRLYQKVFGRKGRSKEWDEFVLSIGA